jgi:hypothetical protein
MTYPQREELTDESFRAYFLSHHAFVFRNDAQKIVVIYQLFIHHINDI